MFDALANQVRLVLQDVANSQRWREFQERCKEVIVALELHKHDTLAQRVEREYCAVRDAANEGPMPGADQCRRRVDCDAGGVTAISPSP